MKITAVIPVRYWSSRFPGKPLANFRGKSILEYVYQQVVAATLIDDIFVATDDERIEKAAQAFGAPVFKTRSEHRCGSERVAELAQNIGSDIFMNIQGDQPFISASVIDQVASVLINEPTLEMSSAATPFRNVEDFLNPNMVKVLCDQQDTAIYFSRYPVPFKNSGWKKSKNWSDYFGAYGLPDLENAAVKKHIGIYGYRRSVVAKYLEWHPSFLEVQEDLEQLRAIEQGVRIRMVFSSQDSPSIDTPSDLEKLHGAKTSR
ncbi:MAG: 3-deoxy-manno-octulosonate cytidylyltransferase [Deltaproteobacteria bacterium]|nr:3-deoxy-manno-octulosonate cytidylyltransferase [Deltaproteobacteria bacterium]